MGDIGLGRLLDVNKEHFGHKPFMATLVLVWASVVAMSLTLIWLFFATVGRGIHSAVTWAGWDISTVSSNVLTGVILAAVIVALAVIWVRFGQRPSNTNSQKHVLDLMKQQELNLESLRRDVERIKTVISPFPSQTDVEEFRKQVNSIVEQVNRLETNLSGVQNSLHPQLPFDSQTVLRGIEVRYLESDQSQFILSQVGSIQRRLLFRLSIRHTTPNIFVETVARVSGAPIVEDERLDALKWSFRRPDPKAILPGDDLMIVVDIPIDERLAAELAFKAESNDEVSFNFSEMRIDFKAMSRDLRHQAEIGSRSLSAEKTLKLHDHIAFLP